MKAPIHAYKEENEKMLAEAATEKPWRRGTADGGNSQCQGPESGFLSLATQGV